MKRFFCILMTFLLVLPLVACGGGSSDSDDPNLGLYEATTGEMMGIEVAVDEIYDGGFSVELKKKGKGKVSCDGVNASMKWTLDGENINIEGSGLKGSGLELDGTLNDGVMILEDVLGSGVKLTLVCEEAVEKAASDSGGDSSEGSDGSDSSESSDSDEAKSNDSLTEGIFGSSDATGSSDKSESSVSFDFDTSGDAGRWELDTVIQDGHYYLKDDLAGKGISSYIQMDPDGTGVIDLMGEKSDMEWSAGKIKVTSGEDKGLEYTYTIGNEYMVINDNGTVLSFAKTEDASGNTATSTNTSTKITEDLIKKYEGDWHGLMLFTNGTGKWKDRDGNKCDVVGRFSMDEDGNVTPFMAAAMKDDPDKYNFRDLEAFLDPRFNEMYISGEFLDGGELREEPAKVENGLFHMEFTLWDGDSQITVEIGMRRLDDTWTDADYPRYSQEGSDFYKGYSLEEILATFGNPPGGVPKQTHVTDWE